MKKKDAKSNGTILIANYDFGDVSIERAIMDNAGLLSPRSAGVRTRSSSTDATPTVCLPNMHIAVVVLRASAGRP